MDELLPLARLPHPILEKAAKAFGEDPEQDLYETRIASVTSATFLEIRAGQWRGAVWKGAGGAWLVAAGKAFGGHDDHKDFYKRLERLEAEGSIGALLPTRADDDLRKRELASKIIRDWRLKVQELVASELEKICRGGETRFTIPEPKAAVDPQEPEAMARVSLEVMGLENDANILDVLLEIDILDKWKTTDLGWVLTVQLLSAVSPPEQEWDRARSTYFNMVEGLALCSRVAELRGLTQEGLIAQSEPGTVAHYVHKRDQTQSLVEGKGMRSICGVWFVQTQPPDDFPTCPLCEMLGG